MNLFIGNLNQDTTDRDLRVVFSEFGEIVTCKVIKDPATGDSRGFGFVEYGTKHAAQDAIDNLDCTYLQGNIISVKEAKQNNTKGPGGNRPNRPNTRYGSGNSGGSERTRTYKPRTSFNNNNSKSNNNNSGNNPNLDSFNSFQY